MLAACNPSTTTAPGAVSEGEAAALEDAAEMLDARRLPEGALPPIGAEAGEEPESGQTTTESDAE